MEQYGELNQEDASSVLEFFFTSDLVYKMLLDSRL